MYNTVNLFSTQKLGKEEQFGTLFHSQALRASFWSSCMFFLDVVGLEILLRPGNPVHWFP